MRKKIIAIDIDEIIRAKWNSIEQHYPKYCELMGDQPEIIRPFDTYEYLNHFKFKEKIVDEKILKDVLKNLPKELYHTKDENGNYLSDKELFDNIKLTLSPENQLYKFLYDEYLWEIFGNSGKIYSNVAQDINEFYNINKNKFKIKIVSLEEYRSIPPTLFFLSKEAIKIADYSFYGDPKRLWKECDILITANPKLLNNKPFNKFSIKINREFNKISNSDIDILNFNDIFNIDLLKIGKFNFKNLFKFLKK